jgi:hypothetical protein
VLPAIWPCQKRITWEGYGSFRFLGTQGEEQ